MQSSFWILITICLTLTQAFFFLAEKHEPILFCIKICPLYCSPRRHDEDASSLIYIEDEPPRYPYYDDSPHPYHLGHYVFCHGPKPTTKPKPTTTTPMPTTTEEPTYILCVKKCVTHYLEMFNAKRL
ncbi:hypothetical protein ABMA27_004865 [Loxostege sticticalis]|uniref:Uncharacterized protein n=1 Tax=Loxostege sticticalis TaxID=481309 RepID=A0ABR3HKZ4_LOXSC